VIHCENFQVCEYNRIRSVCKDCHGSQVPTILNMKTDLDERLLSRHRRCIVV
jgi:hypothetical protein